MNGKAFVLDSNFILDYLKGLPAHTEFMRNQEGAVLWVSVITEMELFSFHDLTDTEKGVLDLFMSSVHIAPLDDRIKNTAISFRRTTRRKIPDSIIAATVINLGATLVTNDKKLLKSTFSGFEVRAV